MNQCKYCRAIHYHHRGCPTGKYRVTERDVRRGQDHSGAVVGAAAGVALDGGIGLIAGFLLGSTLDD